MTVHTQRFKLFSFPDIDRVSTVAILKRFSSGQRWHLIRDISGGYQTQQQKHKWAFDADPSCNFCGQPDTKPHRLLHCCMFASTREYHQEIVQDLNEPDCLLTEFPVCFVGPHTDLLLQLQFRNPKPVFASEALHFVQSKKLEQNPVHWFRDGSCFHPENPCTRYSSFAIFFDVASDDDERKFWGRQCAVSNLVPPTLTRSAKGRTCGEQGYSSC